MVIITLSRETKSSGANADREIFIFRVQLTTSRIGNLTRLIHTLAICVTIHAYISGCDENTRDGKHAQDIHTYYMDTSS